MVKGGDLCYRSLQASQIVLSMKFTALIPFAALACATAFAGRIWVPQNALYLRTDGLTARDGSDDFTGVIPTNDVTDPAYGTPATVAGGAGGVLSPHIDVDREPGNAPVDLTGDDFDLAFTFQFFDLDGQFGFTENFNDRVQINILPVASNTDLSPRGEAGPQHQDTNFEVRTSPNYDFSATAGGGWFHAEVIFVEDGGSSGSAANLGFGFNPSGGGIGALGAGGGGDPADYGGVGYVPINGTNGGQAIFDTDPVSGQSWGSLLVPEPGSLLLSLGSLGLLLRRRR